METDSGNYTVTQPTLSADITAKGLTITGLTGTDKVYDDSTTGSATGTASLSGLEAGDDVSLGGSPVYTFASGNVGTGITLNTSGYTINGTDSGNYTVTQPTLSADITAKGLTITGLTGTDKAYDGTTVGSATGTASLSGLEAGDDVSLGGSPVYTFASANAGTGITLNTTGYTINGTDSGNYTLTQPTLSADITGAALTILGVTVDDKTYDGNTTAVAAGTAIFSGIIGGDDVTLGGAPLFTFVSANVGTGITVNSSGFTLGGTDAGNYNLIQPTYTADITAALLTITGLSGDDKVYDDNTTGSATGTASLSGLEAGDDVSLGGSPVYTFASANVGTGITLNTTGYTINGTDSGNYTVTQPTLSADITAKELTVTGLTGDDKQYDGNTTATASGTATLSGLEVGDDVSLGGSPVYSFASADPGINVTITTTGYTISGTDSGNYSLTQPTLSANIINPPVSFVATSSNGLESVATANIPMILVAASPQTITVDYTVSGTAGSGTDYTLANGTLTFNPGDTSKDITIASIIDDLIVETDETVIVTLSNPVNAILGTNMVHTYTITNDDTAAVTIADISGNENDGDIIFTATIDNAVQGGFTVDVNTADGTATIADSDYTAITSQTLTFAGTAGETQTFTVTPTADMKLEADETFTVSMTNLANTVLGASIDITDGATGTITNDDTAAVTIADISGNENDGVISVTATLDNAVQSGFTVDVGTLNGTATIVDNDYTIINLLTLTFAGTAGETQTFTVLPTKDTKLEEDETIRINQSNLTGTILEVDINDEAIVTLLNDDSAEVTITDVSAKENDGAITLTATLDNGVQGGFSVDVNTLDGTAKTADTDYTAVISETLTFTGTAGETQTFTVSPIGDTKLEANETVTISQDNLSATTLGVVITDTATVTINNDDTASVTISDVSSNEDDGYMTFTATLNNAVDGGFTVDVSTTDGTASVADVDYTGVTSQTLNFTGTAGETQSFIVTPISDNKVEADETFTIGMTNLANTILGSSLDITDSALGIILNDDSTEITIEDIEVVEADGVAKLIATLTNPVQGGFDLHITTTDDTAVNATDYTAFADQLAGTFVGTADETQMLSIPITDDTVGEEIEDFTVTLTSVGNTTLGASITVTDSAIVTIIDDDAPVITMVSVPVDGNYGIGDHLDFSVTFTNPANITGAPSIPITIGTATVQASLNGTFTNSLTADFRYTVVEDDVDTDGIAVGATINLNGGTILGNTNIPAILDLNNVANTANVNVDGIKPTVVISSTIPDPTNVAFDVTITFSKPVIGFTLSDIDVGNGTASNLMGSGSVYTATITPTADGGVTLLVFEDLAQDVVGNNNKLSNEFFVEYDATNPTAVMSTTSPNPANGAFTLDIVFDEAVTGFEISDLSATNATISDFMTISTTVYSVLITPTGETDINVVIGVDTAIDTATNGNVAAQFSIVYDNIPPLAPQITHISDYTCDGNTSITGDNTLEISGLGIAEQLAYVEAFLDGVSIGTTTNLNGGFFTFDYTTVPLNDGTYNFTVTAVDLAGNVSPISNSLTITIDTVDTDNDGIADFCDDDVDGNGVSDTEEDCDGDGIIDSLDTDNSSCGSAILETKQYGFSPNGDGINDGWTVEGIEAYPNNMVQVFNRSGKLVFKAKSYANNWDGISNQIASNGSGTKLPVGPYLFIIDLGDGSQPTRGWIYINY